MEEISRKDYSIEEYLTMLEESIVKLEYNNGSIYSMSGGTMNHAILCSNINGEIGVALKAQDGKCMSFNSEMKVFIDKTNSILFPDGMVVCGKIETAERDKNALTNPILIIEVLSKSTDSYDRGAKFRKYCSLPSFFEYLIIDQNQPIVDLLRREEDTSWNMRTIIGLDQSFYLESIEATIQMKEVYRNTINLLDPEFNLDF